MNSADEKIKSFCRDLRLDIISMIQEAKTGHPGGALSAVELLAILYKDFLLHDPKKPEWPERDRFILSKGHAAPVLYALLAREGYFPLEELHSFRKIGSILQGHPCMNKVPGLDYSGGSLGQGLSFANGIAYGLKLAGNTKSKVYVMTGDGELQEGQIWEAMMTAPHYSLNNLMLIIDYNKLQIDGTIKDVMGLEPLSDKLRAFGWVVKEIDGHKFSDIRNAYALAGNTSEPIAVIANTVKGKGVSILENKVSSHHITGFSDDDFKKVNQELSYNG